MKEKGGIRGTKEWAVAEVNCSRGCPHGCLYCYARYDQVERKRLVTDSEWEVCQDIDGEVNKVQPRYDGQVMFPAAHDIIPENLTSSIKVIQNLLDAGNKVLVVSKPHLECIQQICHELYPVRENILFRFTITARKSEMLKFWEPGAPRYKERLMSLRSSFERGFATSVSIEPMLDGEDVVEMVHELLPYVSHSIWLGKMNKIDTRVAGEGDFLHSEIERIERGQTDEQIGRLYSQLRDVEKIRWKESMKEVLGLDLPKSPGLDV